MIARSFQVLLLEGKTGSWEAPKYPGWELSGETLLECLFRTCYGGLAVGHVEPQRAGTDIGNQSNRQPALLASLFWDL